MNLLSKFRNAIRSSGFDVVRHVPELNRPFSILPLIIQELIERHEDFYFVQVGANDGILDDPLRRSILKYDLKGILIEPLPDLFEKLQQNYEKANNLLFENIAITDLEKPFTIYRVSSGADVPHHWHGIAGFDRGTLESQGVPDEHIEEVIVQGVTFSSILLKHEVKSINLLQIDTEGYDYEVIKSAFNSGIYPEVINYEHCWLRPNVRYECKSTLDKHGYVFLEVGKDTIAVRRGVLD